MSSVVEIVQGDIEKALREALELFPNKPGVPVTVLLAVSGGIDSICLLDAVAAFSTRLALLPVVCHIDHRLRETSAQDAQFVAARAAELKLPLEQRVAPDWDERENVEAWARRIRYQLLESVREQVGAVAVLTAHHQNDQAETFLLRLLSGRLATDSRSIARISLSRRLIRPLLDLSREQLEAYVGERELSWVTDETNSDLRRTRNRVRRELVPQLAAEYNPRIVADTAEIAARLGTDEHLLWGEAERLAAEPDSRAIVTILEHPVAFRWRLLSLLARIDIGEEAGKLGYRKLSLLSANLALISRQSIGFGIDIEVNNDAVRFVLGSSEPPRSPDSEELLLPGVVSRSYGDEGSFELRAEVIEGVSPEELILRASREVGVGDPEVASRAFFDLESLSFPSRPELLVRYRRAGDTVRVFARGSRSLKKLFQERGVRLTLRDVIPIVEQGSRILWVPGVARSEDAPIGQGTKRVLSLSYFRRPNP